jgi:hypothetical protein
VKLLNSGGLFAGDRIRINLNGISLISAYSMVYLDSVDVEKSVVKLSSGNSVTPKIATASQVLNYASYPLDATSYQSQLVELNNVEFLETDRGKPFGDAIGKGSFEYTLADCAGKKISVRTSGFANFASKPLPAGNGKITGVITQYNNDMQFTVTNYNSISMNARPCTGGSSTTVITPSFVLSAPVATLNESFNNIISNADFFQAGWINYNEQGSFKWKGNVKSVSFKSLKASAFGTGEANVMWLISPPVIYKSNMNLSFKTGTEFYDTGHPDPIKAYISTDFNGNNFTAANWLAVPGASYTTGADGSYTGATGMKTSGVIKLSTIPMFSNYSGNLFVAFKYSGTPSFDSNIYLDDVVVE